MLVISDFLFPLFNFIHPSYILLPLEHRWKEGYDISHYKPERRITDIKPKYVGYQIPNEFAVGFGLDYNEKYRNLPFIGVLKEEVYKRGE